MTAHDLNTDPYGTLGVPVDADEQQIKKAYRIRARELHPDVNPDAEEAFKAVAVAYALLSNPTARAAYDNAAAERARHGQPRAAQATSTAPHRPHATDPGRGPRGEASGPTSAVGLLTDPVPASGDIDVPLTFQEAAAGLTLTVTTSDLTGPATLTIPAGTRDGDSVPVPGSRRRIRCHVQPHRYFTLSADGHLQLDAPVTVDELIVGAEIRVPTMAPAPVTLRIPPGTRPGTVLRARGRGLVRDGGATDLLVRLNVITPAGLNSRQLELHRELAASSPATTERTELLRAVRTAG